MIITFHASGEPAPQGSKIPGRRKNGGIYLREANKKLKPWREAVQKAATAHAGKFTGQRPLTAEYAFYLTKPKSVRRWLPWTKPDLDKLIRAVNDPLSAAGIWDDDSRVTKIIAAKYYADEENQPGVQVTIYEENQ